MSRLGSNVLFITKNIPIDLGEQIAKTPKLAKQGDYKQKRLHLFVPFLCGPPKLTVPSFPQSRGFCNVSPTRARLRPFIYYWGEGTGQQTRFQTQLRCPFVRVNTSIANCNLVDNF